MNEQQIHLVTIRVTPKPLDHLEHTVTYYGVATSSGDAIGMAFIHARDEAARQFGIRRDLPKLTLTGYELLGPVSFKQ